MLPYEAISIATMSTIAAIFLFSDFAYRLYGFTGKSHGCLSLWRVVWRGRRVPS